MPSDIITAERDVAGNFRIFRLRGGRPGLLLGTVFFVERPAGKGGWGSQMMVAGRRPSRTLAAKPELAARRRWGAAAAAAVRAAMPPANSQAILGGIEVSPVA